MNKPLPQSALPVFHSTSVEAPAAHLWQSSSFIALILVIAVHAGALGVMFASSAPVSTDIVLPTIQGILLPAPPAETVQLPSAQETPPPVERPPEPVKPKPKPEPKKEVKPAPKPEPVKEAPPSEKAITQEDAPAEESAPPVEQQPVTIPLAEDTSTLGAPVTPPRDDAHQLNNPRPAYPSLSRRLREQGTVLLEVLILADGSVGEIRIKESSGFTRLDQTAVKAVKQWRYTPARRGTEAIDFWYLQPIEFSLH